MYLLRVGRKGVVVLPKELREKMGVKEGDLLVLEEREGGFSVRAIRPLVVKVDLERVDELLGEERVLEESKFERMLRHE
ncbi:MAG: AbrB/MazE/SpoVT family DNA-binding domain-containing protein [Candidatus Freyarchaeota archaeon]|nr:AbrB/MazE/SpoVT family DNA-binding domain-containing protein [Candidatus Jordarchaeia archaeon]